MLPFWRKQVYPYDNIHKLKSLIPFYSLSPFSHPSSKWFTCHFVKLLVTIFGNAHQILANSFFLSLWTSAPGWKWSKRTANYLSLKLLISTTTLLHPPSPRTVETNFWTILSSPFLVFRRVLTAVHKGVQQHLLFWVGKGNYCRVQQWQWQRPTRLVLFLSIQIIVLPS